MKIYFWLIKLIVTVILLEQVIHIKQEWHGTARSVLTIRYSTQLQAQKAWTLCEMENVSISRCAKNSSQGPANEDI